MPTTSAAIVDPIHRRCIECASSVIPSGHPQLSQLPATWSYEHPLSGSAPRTPSPPPLRTLLDGATARCLLIPRVEVPHGLSGRGPRSVPRQALPTPTTVSRRLADPARPPRGGSAGRGR